MAAAAPHLAQVQADRTPAQVLLGQAAYLILRARILPAGRPQGPAMGKTWNTAAWQESQKGQGQGGGGQRGQMEVAGRRQGRVQGEHQGPAHHAHHRQGLQGRVMRSAR